jgi:hypothetical protein
MHKILRILSLLVTLVSASAVDSLPFDDNEGRHAPNSVRRAADDVEKAWDVFASSEDVHYFQRTGCLACWTCADGANYPTYPNNARRLKEDEHWMHKDAIGQNKAVTAMTRKSFNEALDELKLVINSNVQNPLPYERDIKFNFSWEMWTDGKYRMLKSIEEKVMNVVNDLGGWAIKDDSSERS